MKKLIKNKTAMLLICIGALSITVSMIVSKNVNGLTLALTVISILTFCQLVIINDIEELQEEYQRSIDLGFEGLVLRSYHSPYKYGRSTLKEGYFLKMKPIEEYVATILEINERLLNMNESTESTMGYSIKKDTVENKIESGIAATATVDWNGEILKITLTGTEVERIKIWEDRDNYVGRKLMFKGMPYGMKRLPRFPRLIKIL